MVQPKVLIRKLCYLKEDSKEDLSEEKDILSKLRNSLFDESRVMASLGTMTYLGSPRSLSIFFPVAEFDLDDYLHGLKSSGSIRKYPVDPAHLIKEFACLTHALNYLHSEIRLDNGEQFVCVHHDLKPDNILVVADGSPVGRWKVTDFGLSRVKKAESKRHSTGTTLYDHASSVRASLTSPKRRQGSFQPPEIEKVGEKVMGPKSDIWALGCVLCLVLMYATEGVKGVKGFQDRRLKQKTSHGSSASYEHDYFYRGDQLNPHVLSALEETSQVGVWARNCVEIIKKTLQIEPAERPKAKLVMDWLFERVLSELRENTPGSMRAKPPGGSKEISQAVQETGQENMEDTDPTTSQSRTNQWTPYPSSLRPRLSSGFVTFNLDNVKQTSLSKDGEYVAFLCGGNAYVHSVALLEENSRWASKPSRIEKSEGTYLVIPSPEDTVWKAMSFPGAFLALRGWDRRENRDYVRRNWRKRGRLGWNGANRFRLVSML